MAKAGINFQPQFSFQKLTDALNGFAIELNLYRATFGSTHDVSTQSNFFYPASFRGGLSKEFSAEWRSDGVKLNIGARLGGRIGRADRCHAATPHRKKHCKQSVWK